MKREIRLRPLFGGCLGMYLGAWILNTLLSGGIFSIYDKEIRLGTGIALCLGAAGAVILWFRPGRIKARRKAGVGTIGSWLPFIIALLIGAGAAGWLTWGEEVRQEYYDSLSGREAYITGIVMDSSWSSSYGGYYTVYVDTVDEEKEGFLISLESDGVLESGIGVCGTVTFEKLGARQIYDPDQREYSRSKGVRVEAVGTGMRAIEKKAPPVQRILLWGKSIQTYLSGILTELLGDEAGGFSAALFLGNRSVLPDKIKRDFTRLGISHILALSGMHLTVVTGFAGAVGKRIGRRWGIGFSITVALLYMTISGFSPSVTRAGIMLLICMFLKIVGKGSDSFTNLGIAVCTILLCSPGASRDVSLLLSFWGVLGVLLYNYAARKPVFAQEKEQKKGILTLFLKKVKSLGNFFLLSVCVVLFMLPLTCLLFGQVSVLAPLSCVIFTPLATALLWLLPILLFVSPSPIFTGVLLPAVRFLCNVTITLSGGLSQIRGICVSLLYPFAPLLTIGVFCFVLWAMAADRGKRWLPVLCTVATITVLSASVVGWRAYFGDQATATMINSGMDEGTWEKKNDGLVVTSGENTLLVDITSGGYSTLRRGAAVSKTFYSTEIEAVMLTNLHSKHIISLEKLWNREMVRQIWVPDEDSEVAFQLYEKAAAAGIKIVTYTRGDTLSFGNTDIVTYKDGYLDRSVQPIIRLDVDAGSERMVYLGASYAEAFSLEEFQTCPAKIVWFGAHGPLYKAKVDASRLSAVDAVYCTGGALDYVYTGDKLFSNYSFYFREK